MADPKRIDVTVIPAQPGYWLLYRSLIEGDTKAEEVKASWYDDVIAWRIETFERDNGEIYSFVDAIIREGCVTTDYAILRPDGYFDIPHSHTCENLEEYVKHVNGEANG
jgi:hypothetical protein